MVFRKWVAGLLGTALMAMMALSFVGCSQSAEQEMLNHANEGDAESQYLIGTMHYPNGNGLQDYEQARMWFNKAAKQDYAPAQCSLGLMYMTGEGGPVDLQEGLALIKKAANKGDSCQHTLGMIYEEGIAVPKNYRQARVWYEKAANQGDIAAQISLGDIYYEGRGVPRNYPKALNWYRKAANQGNPSAQLVVGGMYGLGLGVPLNRSASYMWCSLSAAKAPENQESCDNFSKLMTPAQIEEGQRLTREWLAQHPNLKN